MTKVSWRQTAGVSACALTALVLALPMGSAAQEQARVQLAGTNQFSDQLHLMIGKDWANLLGGGCVAGSCTASGWEWVAAGYIGVTIDDIPVSAYAHLGIQYVLDENESYKLGLLGFGFANPAQGGPAVRFDAIDVAAFKVGYAWGEEDGWMLGLEVAKETILDLFR